MLAKKLIFFCMLIVVGATVVASGLFAYHARRIIQEQIEKRGNILVQAVAKQAMDAIKSGYFEQELGAVIKSLHHDPDVEVALVVDTQGTILAHSDPAKVRKPMFLSLWDQEVIKSNTPKIRFDKDNNRYIIGVGIHGPRTYRQEGQEMAFPVGESFLNIGALYIGLSQERIERQVRKTFISIGASALAIVVLASLLSVILARKIVKPLKNLGDATQQIAAGNLFTQVPVTSEDEIGQLASQFNIMTKRLRQTTISKNQLESVVAQKTKALREANESLLEANSHLKRLQELESRFVSMASHELRTPLTSISGFVSLMQKYADKLNKDQMANYLNTIASEAARLGRMINEILDLKRIEQGRIELNPTVIDVAALAAKVVDELKIRPNQPNYRVDANGEIKGFLDEDKTKQIFINLLSNSAKYTPINKTVTVELFIVGKSIVINVRDEGPGIPRDLWAKLFHPFARANDEVARKTVGSGLGLAITKSLVETMGGKIRAENLSVGAQFTVVLPQGNVNGNKSS